MNAINFGCGNESQKLHYYIKNIPKINNRNVFRIDKESGKIFLSSKLDYETTKRYQLIVFAENSSFFYKFKYKN